MQKKILAGLAGLVLLVIYVAIVLVLREVFAKTFAKAVKPIFEEEGDETSDPEEPSVAGRLWREGLLAPLGSYPTGNDDPTEIWGVEDDEGWA